MASAISTHSHATPPLPRTSGPASRMLRVARYHANNKIPPPAPPPPQPPAPHPQPLLRRMALPNGKCPTTQQIEIEIEIEMGWPTGSNGESDDKSEDKPGRCGEGGGWQLSP